MPRIFRSMLAEGGKPKVGTESKMLGVRVAPNSHADIPVDGSGIVHPKTGGLSVVPDWRKLPYFLIPERLKSVVPRARGNNDLVCWSLGDGDFETKALNDHLTLLVDQGLSPVHGVVEPMFEMPIDQFQAALAQTRDLWFVDEN